MPAALPTPDRLERIEALTFADEYEAAPPEVVKAAGLGFEWIGEALVVWASRVDVLMFNRAFCIGASGRQRRE